MGEKYMGFRDEQMNNEENFLVIITPNYFIMSAQGLINE